MAPIGPPTSGTQAVSPWPSKSNELQLAQWPACVTMRAKRQGEAEVFLQLTEATSWRSILPGSSEPNISFCDTASSTNAELGVFNSQPLHKQFLVPKTTYSAS